MNLGICIKQISVRNETGQRYKNSREMGLFALHQIAGIGGDVSDQPKLEDLIPENALNPKKQRMI